MGIEGGGNDFPHAPSELGVGPRDKRRSKIAVGRGEDHPPHIRPFSSADWPACWSIIERIIQAGDTLAQPSDMTEAEAHHWWVDSHRAVFVAERDGAILGTYYLTDNQPGRGSHVANGGFLVAPSAAGQGIGRAMGAHSLEAAKALGYQAIQFNLVVATNEASLRIWDGLGFQRIGTLPKAFRHAKLCLIDAIVMYKWLGDA
jgi:RimJ/RimL family protein N-acetyltransferase